jgi:putative membrane protein
MRNTLLVIGLILLVAIWLGPLPELAGHAFYAHMTMHMGVVAVAAPLIAIGIAGKRFDPVPIYPVIFAPIPASILELIVVWVWHTPTLHHAARHDLLFLIAEQGTFLLCGLLLWLSAFGGREKACGPRRAAGVVGLLLTSMHMTLLGALIALSPRPLYLHTSSAGSLTPLEDQHLGGAIMLLVGGISYMAGGLWLMVGLLRRSVIAVREEML